MVLPKIKMSDSISIIDIIKDIEEGLLSSEEIIKKHSITRYKYSCIVKESGIKKKYVSPANARSNPKNTLFKRLLYGDTNGTSFDLEAFTEDCSKGVKISDLMKNYNLSLYQVRELRKNM